MRKPPSPNRSGVNWIYVWGYTVLSNHMNDYILVVSHDEQTPEPYVVFQLNSDGERISGRYFSEYEKAERAFVEVCFPHLDIK